MAKKKKLTSYVHVRDPETGQAGVFGPDDDVPAWAMKLITNPSAFEEPEDAGAEPVPGPGATEASVEAEAQADTAEGDGSPDEGAKE